jgi:hypothetical protein
MALEQSWDGIQEEWQDYAVGLGDIQRLLQDTSGPDLVAQRVAGSCLQQQRRYHPHPADPGDRAVQDGRERISRRLRVAGGQPQRRRCGPHFHAGSLVRAQFGERLLGASGLAQPYQRLQHP